MGASVRGAYVHFPATTLLVPNPKQKSGSTNVSTVQEIICLSGRREDISIGNNGAYNCI